MKLEILKIKEWFFNKLDNVARGYNVYIDADFENGSIVVEDGCVYAQIDERIEESEKAIKVHFTSDAGYGGSGKGWTTWVPKSVLMPNPYVKE